MARTQIYCIILAASPLTLSKSKPSNFEIFLTPQIIQQLNLASALLNSIIRIRHFRQNSSLVPFSSITILRGTAIMGYIAPMAIIQPVSRILSDSLRNIQLILVGWFPFWHTWKEFSLVMVTGLTCLFWHSSTDTSIIVVRQIFAFVS